MKIFTKLVQTGFSQSKNANFKALTNPKTIISLEGPNNSTHMTKNIGFGITHAKHVSEVIHDVPMENYLKKIQKTAVTAHCFNPRTHQQEDVPIRIFRTHYTVTFLPSVQFLEKEYSNKNIQNTYHQQKDSTLSLYKFNCKHCGHQETRSFPQNGFKFGTVITGCDQCHQVMLVSDHLGWIQHKKQRKSSDLIFSSKQVHDFIKKNLKKVGIDASKQKELY